MAYGTDEAVDSLLMVFKFIGKVSSQQVSPRMMGGPWTIVRLAYYYASSRFTALLLFLCLISANLAVINFLPIPVLDGGHMVFLAYEGIRGKPPSENIQIGLQLCGTVPPARLDGLGLWPRPGTDLAIGPLWPVEELKLGWARLFRPVKVETGWRRGN